MSKANLSVNDGIALLTLDDGKANALGFDMQADISAALDEAEAKGDVLVITGRAGVTSAGFDLKVMREQPDKVNDMVTGGGLLLTRLFDFPKPVIIASTGHAIAAGALLMLTGDYRLGIEGDSQYGLNVTAIGMTLPLFGLNWPNSNSPKPISTALLSVPNYMPARQLSQPVISMRHGAGGADGCGNGKSQSHAGAGCQILHTQQTPYSWCDRR